MKLNLIFLPLSLSPTSRHVFLLTPLPVLNAGLLPFHPVYVCAALNIGSIPLGVCNDCLAALAGCCFGILEYSMTDFRKKELSDITA